MRNINFTNKIKLYRRQQDLTQEMLAERVGVSRETIHYLEKGTYNPSLKLAYSVAKELGTTLDNLFQFDTKES